MCKSCYYDPEPAGYLSDNESFIVWTDDNLFKEPKNAMWSDVYKIESKKWVSLSCQILKLYRLFFISLICQHIEHKLQKDEHAFNPVKLRHTT